MFDLISRRSFLERSLGAAVAAQLPIPIVIAGDQKPDDVMQFVDPLVREPAPALSERQNAYSSINAAANALTGMPDGEFEIEDCFNREKPDDARDQMIGAWLDQHEAAIELVNEGIVRGALERPSVSWTDERLDVKTRDLARFLRLRAQRLLSLGQFEQAIETARAMLITFSMLAESGGVFVEFLIAYACEGNSWELMRKIASTPKVGTSSVRVLLDEPSKRPPSRTVLRRVIQAEYCQFLLPILIKADAQDVEHVFRSLVGWSEEIHRDIDVGPSREQYERGCKQFAILFADHPQPYELIDTIKRTSAQYAGFIREFERPWSSDDSRHRQVPLEELSSWPKGLKLSAFELFQQPEDVTDAQVADARKKLRHVLNPIGKEIVDSCGLDCWTMYRTGLERLAQHDGTRLLLASEIFLREQGDLPADLEALVKAKILERVPIDPFSTRPYCYSRDKRAIWSVGSDGSVTPDRPSDEFGVERFVWRIEKRSS